MQDICYTVGKQITIREIVLGLILTTVAITVSYPIVDHYWRKGQQTANVIRSWELQFPMNL
ncbi:MAG: hypothetical protein AAF558_01245 [Verrucomicrobiota bacterium]